MTATNHALTGAVIAAVSGNAWVALPMAFISHFVMDAIPHFGAGKQFPASRLFKIMLVSDAVLCFILVLTLGLIQPAHWQLMAICAFIATSPDFFWLNMYRYIKAGKYKDWKPGIYARFASKIQWFERPIGAIVELVWAVAVITILYRLIS